VCTASAWVVVFPRAVRRPKKTNDKETKGRERIPSEPNRRTKRDERQLTFNLLLLRLEGLAHVLERLSHAENRGLLLLEGLARIR
jgi:hypothetical protein